MRSILKKKKRARFSLRLAPTAATCVGLLQHRQRRAGVQVALLLLQNATETRI